MQIFLNNVKCILFFRSVFIDTKVQAENICKNIFKTGTINTNGIINFPNIPEDFPTCSIKDGFFLINIAKMQIEIIYSYNSKKDYDENIDNFFVKLNDFLDYICKNNILSRIGIINTSLYKTKDKDKIIRNKFAINLSHESSEISLSYNNIDSIDNIRINRLIQILQDINNDNLFVIKDVNTHGMLDNIDIGFLKIFVSRYKKEFYNINMGSIVE